MSHGRPGLWTTGPFGPTRVSGLPKTWVGGALLPRFPIAPTRNRTWNVSFEARDDVRFTTGAKSGRRGSRTLISMTENHVSTVTRPTVSGCLPFVKNERITAAQKRMKNEERGIKNRGM